MNGIDLLYCKDKVEYKNKELIVDVYYSIISMIRGSIPIVPESPISKTKLEEMISDAPVNKEGKAIIREEVLKLFTSEGDNYLLTSEAAKGITDFSSTPEYKTLKDKLLRDIKIKLEIE